MSTTQKNRLTARLTAIVIDQPSSGRCQKGACLKGTLFLLARLPKRSSHGNESKSLFSGWRVADFAWRAIPHDRFVCPERTYHAGTGQNESKISANSQRKLQFVLDAGAPEANQTGSPATVVGARDDRRRYGR